MAEAALPFIRGGRGFGTNSRAPTPTRGRGRGSKNKHWPPTGGLDNERWERGGHRGRGRGRGRGNFATTFVQERSHQAVDLTTDQDLGDETEGEEQEIDGELPLNATQEEREEFWKELVKAREVEKNRAIAEGAMDDPSVPKRLEDAITMVGTCTDMCPRFERYRRERESNLTEFEVIPGTKRVDHRKAVKMYERAPGDKTIPSDLRPPLVLKATLDYLFGDLLEEDRFSATHHFIRDRTRSVRTDFTIQYEKGPLAIECHERCVRYHILAMHILGTGDKEFLIQEERLLMNTLQSLKEFYGDQRGKFESPSELEMRVYLRLIHIRDQTVRHDNIPPHILDNPVFKLTEKFRGEVQNASAPITNMSQLSVGSDGLLTLTQLEEALREQNNSVTMYLISCILERLFGKGTIQDENLKLIRGDLSISDMIDGLSHPPEVAQEHRGGSSEEVDVDENPQSSVEPIEQIKLPLPTASHTIPSVFGGSTSSPFGILREQGMDTAPPKNAFSALVSTSNHFTASSSLSVFGGVKRPSAFAQPAPDLTPSLSEKPQEFMLYPHRSNGLTSSQAPPSPFPPALTVQPTSVTKLETSPTILSSRTVLELPLPRPPLTETAPLPLKAQLNPSAPAFVSLKPPPPFLPLGSPPKAPHPAPIHTFIIPKSSPSSETQLAGPSVPSTTNPLERPQTASTAELVGKGSKSWDLPGLSGPRRPPRINTDLMSDGTTPSPKIPPPLKRAEPISLPPTTPLSSHPSFKGNKFLKSFPSIQNIQTPGEILSPLNLTPSINAREFSFTIPANQQPELSVVTRKLDSIAADVKTEEDRVDVNDKRPRWIADAKMKATRFKSRGVLVKNCFSCWKRRLMDRVEYLEAVEKSEEYSKKLQIEREPSVSASVSSNWGDKKRRVSGLSPNATQRKRARKRQSIKYAPSRTDDDLVKRLQENHEENERRWAPGTFITSLRERLKRENLPPNWLVWLSTNQETDGTAIWLQRKFDVPSSGTWLSNNIFQIAPATATAGAVDGAPGLIIFECTPFEDLDDELEGKYRILDDCTRLRDILSALPERPHFVPSLLVILWSEQQPSVLGSDLQSTVSDLIGEGILKSFFTFAMTKSMNDADSKFLEAVSSIQFDFEGELAVQCTGSSLMRSLSMEWTENLSEWTDSCLVDGRVDWASYCEVLQASSRIMDSIANHVTTLTEAKAIHLPLLVAEKVGDFKSALRAITSWLDNPAWMRVSSTVLMHVQSYETSGADPSISDFSSRLPQLLSAALGIACGRTLHTSVYIVKEEYDDRFKQFRDQLRSENDALVESRAMRNSRLLSKRSLPSSNGPENQNSYKRARTIRTPSPSPSFVEEPPSPSSRSLSATPSATVTKPAVTLDMLREFTKSVMKNYQT